jgi:hypothetical protein
VDERSFKRQGVDVTIREDGDRVELELDGHPVPVSRVEGKYLSQFAHMFKTFDSVDAVVDTLLENEGRTWTLSGGAPGSPLGGHGSHEHGGHEHGGHEHGGHGGHR